MLTATQERLCIQYSEWTTLLNFNTLTLLKKQPNDEKEQLSIISIDSI